MAEFNGTDGQLLGKAIVSIILDTRTERLDRLLERLESLEAATLAQVAGDAFKVIETKRRIAEAGIHVAVEKRAPFAICRGFFDRLRDLGFSTPDSEFTFCGITARYALKSGHEAFGIQLLEPFVKQWESEGLKRPFRVRDLKLAKGLLQKLRSNKRTR